MCCAMLSHVSQAQLFATRRTVAHQPPVSMEFSWQEYWNELLCPLAEGLSDPGIEPVSLKPPALAGKLFATNATWQALKSNVHTLIKNTLCVFLIPIPGGSVVKNLPANAEDTGSIPDLGGSHVLWDN